MPDTIMTVFAVLFIIAFVGLIIAIISTVTSVQDIIGTCKRAASMIDKPKLAALRLAQTGKRVGFSARDHAVVIGSHAKTGAEHISNLKRDFTVIADAFKID